MPCHLQRIYLSFSAGWMLLCIARSFFSLSPQVTIICSTEHFNLALVLLLMSVCCDSALAWTFVLMSVCCDTALAWAFLLVSLCCDTALAWECLLVSVCCDTAQAWVFLLVSACYDTARASALLLVSVCCDTARPSALLLVSTCCDTAQAKLPPPPQLVTVSDLRAAASVKHFLDVKCHDYYVCECWCNCIIVYCGCSLRKPQNHHHQGFSFWLTLQHLEPPTSL